MQLLKKPSATATAVPVTPKSVQGLAFCPVDVHQFIEIELFNQETFDTVATLTVDGLETANTFSADKNSSGQQIIWPGYLVRAGTSIRIRGWLHTIDQSQPDNLFAFRVAKLGEGAASALNTRGSVGVITVQFREACPPDGKLSGRSFGEIAKGEALPEKLKAVPVQIGANVLSTVSIRYNRPE
ncbi:hypothetical protein GC163_17230 [bacterium]|nr:hypothetical protein [bacterium]